MTYDRWTTEWTSDPRAAHTKHFYNGPSTAKARSVYSLARLELGRFVRLITGHNNLNYFQHRLGLWGTNACRFCESAAETFIHLMEACPRWWQTRTEYFLDNTPSNDMRWSVRSLLDYSYIPAINLAFEGTWAHGDPVDDAATDSMSSDSGST